MVHFIGLMPSLSCKSTTYSSNTLFLICRNWERCRLGRDIWLTGRPLLKNWNLKKY